MKGLVTVTALSLGLFTAASEPAQAYTIWQFWPSPPNACTATNPSNPGTFLRNETYNHGRYCSVPGRGYIPMYATIKADWAEEWYGLSNGWLVIVQEKHPNLCGDPRDFRIWRQYDGTVGIDAMKRTFFGYLSWTLPAFQLLCGYGCGGSASPPVDIGAGDYVEQGLLGIIWDKLKDCRSGPCAGPYAMEVMFYAGTWGSGLHKEEYWFGRWDDPGTGAKGMVDPVGLVRFQHFVRSSPSAAWGQPVVDSWSANIVGCNLVSTCPFC